MNFVDEKKDLTALTILAPDSSEEPSADAFTISPEPAIDGLDDLLSPMSPAASGSEFDPLAGLPPIDPETAALASGDGHSSDFTSSDFQETPMNPEKVLDEPIKESVATEDVKLSEPTRFPSQTSLPMQEVRHYSDHLAPSGGAVTAETPFSLLIDGFLKTHEREALLTILARENLGIREVELEPQFEAGRILIPRISEFAGVLIVQALRNAGVKMRLNHSDKIYVSKNSQDEEDALIFPPNADSELLMTEEGEHPADGVILSPDESVKGRRTLDVLDTLHGSMNLKAAHVAHPQSPLFQDALEKLKRQLKFQAHHRGANALLSFKYELHPLEGQTVYKLVVQAKAVRLSFHGDTHDSN